ncbi:hypothetical protein BD626DRAFT_610607, partial [Schizophyllum amplum]
ILLLCGCQLAIRQVHVVPLQQNPRTLGPPLHDHLLQAHARVCRGTGRNPGVADAVRQHAPELKLNDAGDQVTRAAGPPKQEDNSVMGRSVYAKGFGEPTPTLQRELEEYFQQYGPTNVVRMRRDDRKKFKGSVFAEFKEPASVDKFLNADPKPTWKGAELLIMSKQAYCDMKIKEKGIDPSKAYNFNAFNKDGGNRDRRPKEKDANAMDEDAVVGRDIYLEFMSQRLAIKRDAAGEGCVDAAQLEYGDKQRGSTLKFSGVGGDMGPWSAVKDPIREAFARAPYIKFTREEDSGLVGFSAPLSDEDIEKSNLLPKMNDKPVTWERAGEEEEKAFLIERVQAAAKSALAAAAGRGRSDRDSGRGRGGGRGGRGRGRGRGEGRGRGRGGRDVQMAKNGGKRERAVEHVGSSLLHKALCAGVGRRICIVYGSRCVATQINGFCCVTKFEPAVTLITSSRRSRVLVPLSSLARLVSRYGSSFSHVRVHCPHQPRSIRSVPPPLESPSTPLAPKHCYFALSTLPRLLFPFDGSRQLPVISGTRRKGDSPRTPLLSSIITLSPPLSPPPSSSPFPPLARTPHARGEGRGSRCQYPMLHSPTAWPAPVPAPARGALANVGVEMGGNCQCVFTAWIVFTYRACTGSQSLRAKAQPSPSSRLANRVASPTRLLARLLDA